MLTPTEKSPLPENVPQRRIEPATLWTASPSTTKVNQLSTALRVDTAVEIKLAYMLVETSGHCSTVLGKFLIVLDFLLTTTSTDTLASKGTLILVTTLKQKLSKLVTTVSSLKLW